MISFLQFYNENYKLPSNFNPKIGSCMIAAEIITKKLIKQKRNFKVVEGYVEFPNVEGKFTHTWIELEDGNKIDPTVNQWETESEPVYIPKTRYSPEDYLEICSLHPTQNRKQYFNG